MYYTLLTYGLHCKHIWNGYYFNISTHKLIMYTIDYNRNTNIWLRNTAFIFGYSSKFALSKSEKCDGKEEMH